MLKTPPFALLILVGRLANCEISDWAHGGNKRFLFVPPTVSTAPTVVRTLDKSVEAHLSATIQVLNKPGGPLSMTIALNSSKDTYIATVTGSLPGIPTLPGDIALARVTVMEDGKELGHGDICLRGAPLGTRLSATAQGSCPSPDQLLGSMFGPPPRSYSFRVLTPLNFTAVTTGDAHTCALEYGGSAFCWGLNTFGQLGTGVKGGKFANPQPVATGMQFLAISAGASYTCAVDIAGEAWCWGLETSGNFGKDSSTDTDYATPQPVKRPAASKPFVSIAAASSHTCAIDQAKQAWCWGSNGHGELGTGSNGNPAVKPVQPVRLSEVTRISVGAGSTCAIAKEFVYCWGDPQLNKLGHKPQKIGTPTPILRADGVGFMASDLTMGVGHVCAVNIERVDLGDNVVGDLGGRAMCWGGDVTWNLVMGLEQGLFKCATQGYNDFWCSDNPVQAPVREPLARQPLSISSFSNHVCGITENGVAYCWGSNDSGQQGNGDQTQRGPFPWAQKVVNPPGELLNFKKISAGSGYTCGLTIDGEIYCWGSNPYGQVGSSTTDQYWTPQHVIHP